MHILIRSDACAHHSVAFFCIVHVVYVVHHLRAAYIYTAHLTVSMTVLTWIQCQMPFVV